jgi:hypothetical protein
MWAALRVRCKRLRMRGRSAIELLRSIQGWLQFAGLLKTEIDHISLCCKHSIGTAGRLNKGRLAQV